VEGMRLHVFDTGSIDAPEGLLFRGGNWLEPRSLPVLAFVVEHPDAGLVVFDTGFSQAIADDAQGFLGSFMSRVVKPVLAEGGTLGQQMAASGLESKEVSHVVLSHMHFDHTGALEEFSGAVVVIASSERNDAEAEHWPLDGFIESDWDEVSRWAEIDYAAEAPYATFIAHHDLLGDGSLVLIDLRGHTAGSQGMIVMLPAGPVLITGDAAWTEESWRYAARPMMAHDMDLWWEQIWRVKKFVQLVPATLVMPGHDRRRLEDITREDVVLH